MMTLKDVLRHVVQTRAVQWTAGYAYETLAREFGCTEDEAYSAMETAEDEGYVECGVSLRTGWLTPKGDAFLEAP